MASVKQIDLDNDGSPEFITVRLCVEEAAYIAKIVGRHSDVTANDVMDNGAAANGALYNALTGEFFNRFWDGGVDDALDSL